MPKATTIIGLGQTLGAVGVGVLAVAVSVYVYDVQRKAGAAEAQRWSLEGTPCPTIDAAAYAQAPGEAKATPYDGITFEYRVGHMVCTHRPDAKGGGEHGVCQFTGPELLGMKSPQASAYFAPKGMSAVRVAVIDGQARCVLIPPFQMKDVK